jgi:hypothetical protein
MRRVGVPEGRTAPGEGGVLTGIWAMVCVVQDVRPSQDDQARRLARIHRL